MRRLVTLVAVVGLLAAGCSQPGADGYRVSASFERATALYEQSRVKVMGLDVGHVERIGIEGDRIRVDMRIDPDVPLPDDVEATITPLTLIGERNVVLAPAWTPGDERAAPGHRITAARSHVTAEPDDVLETVMDVTTSLDAERMGAAVETMGDALDGRGERLNEAIAGSARLARVLREQDDDLLAAAEGLSELARTLDVRERQLRELVATFAEATEVLSAERDELEPFLRSLLRLMEEGEVVLTAYEDRLPRDLAGMGTVALALEGNTDSVNRLVDTLPEVADMLVEAHRPDTHAVKLRFSGGSTSETLLRQLAEALGLPAPDCIPTPDRTCEEPS